MSSKRFNAKSNGTVRVIHLRTGAAKLPRALTCSESEHFRMLLVDRLHTLRVRSGTDACVGVALSGAAWITLVSGSLPSRTCMDMSAYAAGALAMMMAKEEQ